MGQRLDGVPVLEPFLERRQIVVHPALIQPDGFQSFLHTPHLRAALLQTGEEALHLHNTKIHIKMMTHNTENSAISSSTYYIKHTWSRCACVENWEVADLMIVWMAKEPTGNLWQKTIVKQH